MIPAHIVKEIVTEAVEMTAWEDFVVEQVRTGETITGLYPQTRSDHAETFARWRKDKGR